MYFIDKKGKKAQIQFKITYSWNMNIAKSLKLDFTYIFHN
jgi:hypothetical protein